jgi:hypothetical protein
MIAEMISKYCSRLQSPTSVCFVKKPQGQGNMFYFAKGSSGSRIIFWTRLQYGTLLLVDNA